MIVVAKNLIQYHQGWARAAPTSRLSTMKNQPESIDNHGGHLPDYQTMRKRCAYCLWRVKKTEHSPSVWLVTFQHSITLRKEKKLFPRVSHLGVHVTYI